MKKKKFIENILKYFKHKIEKVEKKKGKIMLIIDTDNNNKPIHIGLFDFNGETKVSIDIGFSKEDYLNSDKKTYVEQIFSKCQLNIPSKEQNGIILGSLEKNEKEILEKIRCFLECYNC